MVVNNDPLTYRYKRTLIEAFGTDADNSIPFEVYKIRPRFTKMAAEVFAIVYICAIVVYAFAK
jgi:hypothetical protein